MMVVVLMVKGLPAVVGWFFLVRGPTKVNFGSLGRSGVVG